MRVCGAACSEVLWPLVMASHCMHAMWCVRTSHLAHFGCSWCRGPRVGYLDPATVFGGATPLGSLQGRQAMEWAGWFLLPVLLYPVLLSLVVVLSSCHICGCAVWLVQSLSCASPVGPLQLPSAAWSGNAVPLCCVWPRQHPQVYSCGHVCEMGLTQSERGMPCIASCSCHQHEPTCAAEAVSKLHNCTAEGPIIVVLVC
jgi:hypothetical protein